MSSFRERIALFLVKMSASDSFRKQQIILPDTGKEITLEAKKIREIFRFNQPAYLIFGSSGAGKSTIATDLIYTFSEECTNIYYITATTESLIDKSIAGIPKCFRREPTLSTIMNTWEEIKNTYETVKISEDRLFQLIKSAYGDKASDMITEIQQETTKILREQTAHYKSVSKDVGKAANAAQRDAYAFLYEAVIAIIDDYIKREGDGIFSNDEMSLIKSFYSKTRPKTLYILDDITGQLEEMSKSNNKMIYEGKPQKEKDIIHAIFTDILTRCRHYNAIVCIFLHSTVSCLTDKSLITNVICMNEGAIDKICNARTMPETTKSIMKIAKDYVFNGGYKYYFLYINSNEVDRTCVGKANLHLSDEEVKLNRLNENFKRAYETVSSGIEPKTPDTEETINIDELSSSDGEIESFI